MLDIANWPQQTIPPAVPLPSEAAPVMVSAPLPIQHALPDIPPSPTEQIHSEDAPLPTQHPSLSAPDTPTSPVEQVHDSLSTSDSDSELISNIMEKMIDEEPLSARITRMYSKKMELILRKT